MVRRKLDTMTDQEIFEFLNDVWKPPQQYTFPQHEQCKRKWRFNPIYVTPGSPRYYPWLVYSRYYDGVFCLPCVVFGNRFPGSKLQKLYTEPLTRWNGASTKFLEHQKSCQMHHDTVAAMETFKSQLSGKSQRIDVTFDTIKYERIRSNRQKLIPILKTVILCARQNISFRGHRDDSKHFDDRSNNPGNFQTLLEFRVDSGDRVLDDHFKTAPKNATYRSKSIQNELIESCGKHIRQKISKEIQSARFFSVIADEASDCSQTEQLSLVIRFIDENSTIREEFVEFVKCESTSAEYLTNKITQAVENLSLNMRNLRGQAYDGAGNMAGSKSGVSTRIRNVYPKALYFHCSSHRLNLAVASSSSIRGVKNMMDSIGKCSEIFYFSPKKKELLKRYTLELMPEDRRTTLLNVCKTRWLQRIDGLARVQEMIEPILTTLDLIATNHDGSYAKEARSDAQGVYWTFKSFQFAIHLIIVRNVISYTNSLTYELQEKQLDIVKVYEAVDNVIVSLEDCRSKVDEKHKEWYAETVAFADHYLGCKPSIKRTAGQQVYRANYPITDPSEFYKVSLTIPLLDRVIAELKSRFSPQHRIHSSGFYLLPSVVVKTKDWKDQIREFAKQYKSDLPIPLTLETELDQWEIFWKIKTTKELPDTIASTLVCINDKKKWFPNLYAILCLVGVVPASSNSCERSISKLRTVKTYLRSTMLQERLSSLALVHIHREMELDLEAILTLFANDNPHRIVLLDILADPEPV